MTNQEQDMSLGIEDFFLSTCLLMWGTEKLRKFGEKGGEDNREFVKCDLGQFRLINIWPHVLPTEQSQTGYFHFSVIVAEQDIVFGCYWKNSEEDNDVQIDRFKKGPWINELLSSHEQLNKLYQKAIAA